MGRGVMKETEPIRVLSNVRSFKVANSNVIENHYLDSVASYLGTFWSLLRVILASQYDVIFFNCDVTRTMMAGLLLTVFPFKKCKLISADPVLRVPQNRWRGISSVIKRQLLKRVDSFILFHKDFSSYTKWFGIDSRRVIYVPFKVNSLDFIQKQPTQEGEYIFTGGVSLRDWETLAAAMSGVDIPLWIVTKELTADRFRRLFTDHTRWIQDDGTGESWIRFISGAKFVVLPIARESAAASGISTYLSAMALRKCVIISEGPATRGILTDGREAIIVPSGDPDALRTAILRVNADQNLRKQIAEGGYKYAMSCGDTSRLYQDYVDSICRIAGVRKN